MKTDDFLSEAGLIASRNLTPNVSAVSVAFSEGHLSLTYHVRGAATDEDEEERELTAAELCAAYPEIRTCETFFEGVEKRANPSRNERIVWPKDSISV